MGYEFFKQFGEVESTRFGHRKGIDNLIVQFEDATVSNDLVKKGEVEWNGCQFLIKPFHEKFDSKDELLEYLKEFNITNPQPPPEHSQENIMTALNDECLGHIFEKIHNLADIYSITNVCQRFKKIGKETFPSVMKHEEVRFTELIHEGGTTLADIENFLRDFGASISWIVFWEHQLKHIPDVSNNLLKMVHKYCTNLEHLEIIYSTDIKNQTIADIRPLLSKLKYLETVYVGSDFDAFSDFISECTQLETLKMRGISSFALEAILPEINFPKLIHFQIDNPIVFIDSFLEKNSQIEELSVPYTPEICKLISTHLPKIRKLTLHDKESFEETDCMYLKNRQHLEISMYKDITPSIVNIFPMRNITALSLTADTIFDTSLLVKVMDHLRNLKTLNIWLANEEITITTDLLKEIVLYGNNMSKLEIQLPKNVIYHCDEKEYYEILDKVETRCDIIKLELIITATTTMVDKSKLDSTGHNRKLIRMDMVPDWLSITKIYEYDAE